ncbi:YlxR family protein [Nocardioides sp. GY 10127]|uniref:YlxR family protein n=1 Tax=Nocardioides sp. GY 10127 TaxID=2569762 RepID=UPI0010A788D8|nr:YlxR family protein [Nocardioides sp. GY 10127]TIC80890.1 YlxR family protein [Nocardioides sp. GY 10127]
MSRSVVPADPAGPSTDGPVRTCIGCRARAPRRDLLRTVVGKDDAGMPAVVPDPRGSAAGRGAHLHPTTACYELAVRRKAFPRALRHAAGGALSAGAVGEYLERVPTDTDTADQAGRTTRNWSSSS